MIWDFSWGDKYYEIKVIFEQLPPIKFKTKDFIEKESQEETVKTILQKKYGDIYDITECRYNYEK